MKLTVETLSEILHAAGVVPHDTLKSFKKRIDRSTPFARGNVEFLELEFSPGSDLATLTSIVAKTGKSKKEADFYSRIAPSLPHPPLVECYFCEYDEKGESSFFLLEDISTTCQQTQWPIPPSRAWCEAAIDALSLIHAERWNKHEDLAILRSSVPAGRTWDGRFLQAIEGLPKFYESLGDRIVDERRQIFQQVLPTVSRSFERNTNTTLIHGDAHLWNFLFPVDPSTQGASIIDWNMWDIGRGTDDLAYMMGLHWYPERRARLEEPLLRRYFAQLMARGVSDYSWDMLWDDYRLSCVRNLLIPVWQWGRGINPSIWWFHLERSFLTYKDIKCEEVL